MGRARHHHRLEPLEPPDAVIHMHHQIAGGEFADIGDEQFRPAPAAARPHQPLTQNVLLADDHDIAGREAVLEPEHRDRGRFRRKFSEGAPTVDLLQPVHAVTGEEPGEAFTRARGETGDQHPPAAAKLGIDVLAHDIEHAGFGNGVVARGGVARPGAGGGEIDPPPPAEIDNSRSRSRGRTTLTGMFPPWPGEGRETADRPRLQGGFPLPGGEVEPLRRQRPVRRNRPVRRPPAPAGIEKRGAGVEELRDGFQPGRHRRVRLMVEGDHRVGQIVEQGLEPVVEQRQPVLHADLPSPRGDRHIERVVADRAERLAVPGAEAGDGIRIQEHLADRIEGHPFQLRLAQLCRRVEAPDALDDIAEQIEAHRRRRARREDVDDAAAERVLARLAHRAGAHVAVAGEEPGQRVEVERPTALHRERGILEGGARRHPLEGGIHRGQHDAAVARRRPAPGEACQRAGTLARHLAIGRDPVIGQAVPGGERQHLDPGREEGDTGGQGGEPGVVAGDVQHHAPGVPIGAPGEPGKHQRVHALGHPGDQGSPRVGKEIIFYFQFDDMVFLKSFRRSITS